MSVGPREHGAANKYRFPIVGCLFLCSGATGLCYEILWLEELRLLFGNGAQATSMTLTIFFAGLAGGAYYWGHRSRTRDARLRDYGRLELAVAAAALGYFVLTGLYQDSFSALAQWLHTNPSLLLLLKAGMALSLLGPAAFFMGGTLPVLAHALQGHGANEHAPRLTTLYALNIMGALLGAAAAGFLLPRIFGFNVSYGLNLGLTLLVGAVAVGLDRSPPTIEPERSTPPPTNVEESGPWRSAAVFAGASGLLTLALQVAWTRALALVFHNSSYTFALIVCMSICALALGAWLADHLTRWTRGDHARLRQWLARICSASAIATALSPWLLVELSEGLRTLEARQDFMEYLRHALWLTSATILVPGLLVACVFPLALTLGTPKGDERGLIAGRLTSVNAACGALGALISGFVALPSLGLWNCIFAAAGGYLVLGLFLLVRPNPFSKSAATAIAAIVVFAGLCYRGQSLPHVELKPAQFAHGRTFPGERLLALWETSAASVAVIARGEQRHIEVDNNFSLGSNIAAQHERRQAQLPLTIHPAARSVFFLGMGTGISASGALSHPLEKITVAELLPEVIEASRLYFAPEIGSLFTDPRVNIVAEDGRHYLSTTAEFYDVIIADLFFPFTAGSSSLYSRDHYRKARTRLTEGGVYAQWLPLHQLGWSEFASIAHTMLDSFEQVTLWRGDAEATRPIALLLGHTQTETLQCQGLSQRVAHSQTLGLAELQPEHERAPERLLHHYVGRLDPLRAVFRGHPINTDDQPYLQYSAPVSLRNVAAGREQALVGGPLRRMLQVLEQLEPAEDDPFLAACPDQLRTTVARGRARHRARLQQLEGQRLRVP